MRGTAGGGTGPRPGALFTGTGTGTAFAELARSTLTDWAEAVDAACRRPGSALSVGSTRCTLGCPLSAVEPPTAEFARRGVAFELVHVRTRDMFDKLRAKEVVLIYGSTATGSAPIPRSKGST